MDYLPLFLMGLAGSLHCAGMCGPICLALAKKSNASGFDFSILGYHFSRIFAYMVMGLFLFFITDLSGINRYQNIISIVVGISIIVFVFFTAFWNKIELILSKFPVYHWIRHSLGKMLRSEKKSAIFFAGFLNGLLPCGLVYIALLNGFRQQEISTALLSMFLFGLGTLPMMVMISYGSYHIKRSKLWLQSRIAITTVLALFFILRGLNLGIPLLSPDLSTHTHTEINGTMCH